MAAPQDYHRHVGPFSGTMLIAGSMIGSGIFIVPAEMVRTGGTGAFLVLAWLFTAALTLLGAHTYGELAGMFPRAGGQYVYLRESYGPLTAFLYGWTVFLIIECGSIAAVAMAFGKFLGTFAPAVSESRYLLGPLEVPAATLGGITVGPYHLGLTPARVAAIAVIAGLSLLNGFGSRAGVWVQNTFTLANLIYLKVLGPAGIARAPGDRVGSEALRALLGARGDRIMAAAILVSTFGCANGMILAGSRLYQTMARDGLFFPAAARLNRFRVPGAALALQAAWASLLTLTGNYGQLLEFTMFAALLFYTLTVAGVIVLRRRRPGLERPVRIRAYPLVPALYIAGALATMGALLRYRPSFTWPGLALVALGLPCYGLIRRRGAGRAQDRP